jgi:hypothetical protein
LQQLRIERHPVISKTKRVLKLQKKYKDYINSVNTLRDTVGKLKIQSVKIKEGIGKWKHQQKISNQLLQDFLNDEDSNVNYSSDGDDDDDCFEASSSAPQDKHFDDYDSFHEHWTPITQPPNPDHQCRYVHHERRCPIRPHLPTCPIQAPKNTVLTCNTASKTRDIPMETPMVNENGMLAKKLNEFQNDLQNHHNRKQTIDERIAYLRREVKSLIRQDAYYDTISDVELELSSLISEGA